MLRTFSAFFTRKLIFIIQIFDSFDFKSKDKSKQKLIYW